MDTFTPYVSIIIPTHNRAPSLERTLRSLAELDYPAFRYEIIVVDDGSTDETPRVIEEWRQRLDGRMRGIRLAKGHIVHAKNAGLSAARGAIIATTDDDCTFPHDWLTHLTAPFADPEAGASGGYDRSPEEKCFHFAEAVDYAFTGMLGSGGVRSGHGAIRAARFYPRGCNMAFRKDIAQALGGFDDQFFNGEDIDLDYRIMEAGYRTVFCPHCFVLHHRRADWKSLVRQLWGRGLSRRMLFKKHPAYQEPGYMLPAGMVLLACLLMIAALFAPPARVILAAACLAYGTLLMAGALSCGWKRRYLSAAGRVPLVLLLSHVVYGSAFLAAPFTHAFRALKKRMQLENRRPPGSAPCILISNDGFGANQGDRAILRVMQADFRSTFSGVRMRGFLNAWLPGCREMARFLRDLRWADVFILGGGQVLHDQTCLMFLMAGLGKIMLARMLGTPAVCYGIGAGPISFSVGRWMVRRVLRSCPLIIVRDRSSRELLIQCGVDPARIQVTADVAFRLPAVSTGLSELYPAVFDKPRKRPLIGIFPRRWFQYGKAVLPVRWQRRVTNHKASRAMIQLLADTADTLICEDQAAVVLVPMKRCGGRRDPGQDDDTLCYEIRRHMKFGDQVTVADKETCPEQLRAFIGQMDAVISMRMHAMIFAAGQGVPFAALSLSAKFDDLAERLETTECMIPVQQANKARLLECARQVIDWPPARRCRLQDHARQLADCSARNPELFNEWWANVKAAQRY